MSDAICSFPGCGKPVHGHGMCSGHWIQWSKGLPLTPLRPTRRPTDDPVKWFLSWFDTSGGPGACHEWQRHRGTRGYGRSKTLSAECGTDLTHRIRWILAHGPIPDGMLVCHSCDNPLCGNIDHLFLGTPEENTHDMLAKGRHRYFVGEENRSSRITEETVRAIRVMVEAGETQRGVARHFSLSPSHVHRIVARTLWQHVD